MANFKLNTSEDLNRFKEEFNSVIENHIESAKMSEIKESVDSLSLGDMRNIFESTSDKLFESRKGKRLISKYVRTITENKDLKQVYGLYSNIYNPSYVKDVNMYLAESLNLSNSIDKENYANGLKNLSAVIKDVIDESKISYNELKTIIESRNEIEKSIEYLALNKKKLSNISEHINHFSAIRDFVESNLPKNKIDEHCSTKELFSQLQEAVSECGKAEWEKSALKDIAIATLSNSNKKSLFETYKNACVELIEEKMESESNIETKSHLSTMKTQLEGREFNEESLAEDILTLAELKNTLCE